MACRRAALAFLLLAFASYPEAERTSKDKPAVAAAETRKAGTTVNAWMKRMTLRDRIAQLVMVTSFGDYPSSLSQEYRSLVQSVRDLRVGGIIVVNRVVNGSVRSAEPHAMASFLNRMQRLARVPLIVGADFERGASMRVSGTAKYPHLMTYGAAGDLGLTGSLGEATAREARALGVHWVFAPDADVNNNPDNPIISIRSFGESPREVANHVQAFIRGAHSRAEQPVLVTAKHFPGHGDTAVDSHVGMPVLKAGRQRLETLEFVPFRAAIEAGVDAVMTAHMAVPSLEPSEVPATVSRAVLTGVLRDEFGFNGLIVTDAMDMAGLTQRFPGGEAAVRALEAGADVLLMPPDPAAVIEAVETAVNSGRLARERIDKSVSRVLSAKVRVGLHRRKLVDIDGISDVLQDPELHRQAQLAADRGVTLVKNENGLVPLAEPDRACVYVLPESSHAQQGRRMVEEISSRSPKTEIRWLEPDLSAVQIGELAASVKECESAVVAAFVSVAAYRGNVALRGNYPKLMEALLSGSTPVALVALGSPYLLRSYPKISAYLATYSPVITAETAAVKALFGEVPITGHLPVTIPGVAGYGEGIMVRK